MTNLGLLDPRPTRRSAPGARRRSVRRRRLAVLVVAVLVALTTVLLGAGAPTSESPIRHTPSSGAARAAARTAGTAAVARRHDYALDARRAPLPIRLTGRARSGLLFDVASGRVLWERRPDQRLPIASLTKMMTALVVVAHARPDDRVLINREAIDFSGSGVGLLPLDKRVPLSALLYGLLLPSGNDAAIALADHVGGTQTRFIAMMNQEAEAMGLRCTHFATASGLVDQNNFSCASDLAIMAHAVLTQPRLERIVSTRSAILPFPVKGGRLYLFNNNPLLLMRYPGADGVKTGWTVAAGSCLVAAARRGRHWFGVVVLHSDNSPDQAQRLLDAAFAHPQAPAKRSPIVEAPAERFTPARTG